MELFIAILIGAAFGIAVRIYIVRKRREKREDHERLMRDIRNSPPIDEGVNDL